MEQISSSPFFSTNCRKLSNNSVLPLQLSDWSLVIVVIVCLCVWCRPFSVTLGLSADKAQCRLMTISIIFTPSLLLSYPPNTVFYLRRTATAAVAAVVLHLCFSVPSPPTHGCTDCVCADALFVCKPSESPSPPLTQWEDVVSTATVVVVILNLISHKVRGDLHYFFWEDHHHFNATGLVQCWIVCVCVCLYSKTTTWENQGRHHHHHHHMIFYHSVWRWSRK